MEFVPGPEIIFKYFPELNALQQQQFREMGELYHYWNQRINVISRKDISSFYQNHVLHSLGIARVAEFGSRDRILDVGTGGGFPGIPLAILFPETNFYLIDSIGKKIKVVKEVIAKLQLTNVDCDQIRAEEVKDTFQYIISRAVTQLDRFLPWVNSQLATSGRMLFLKGGDLSDEIAAVPQEVQCYRLKEFFSEPYFQTKMVLSIGPEG